mmetsp:Transcript_43505/g.102519  ORF Transcript_43505/g.102519 Transcript_43505/m.102519 type:complete len:229 (-) Transcript_43505:778-1464(-)
MWPGGRCRGAEGAPRPGVAAPLAPRTPRLAGLGLACGLGGTEAVVDEPPTELLPGLPGLDTALTRLGGGLGESRALLPGRAAPGAACFFGLGLPSTAPVVAPRAGLFTRVLPIPGRVGVPAPPMPPVGRVGVAAPLSLLCVLLPMEWALTALFKGSRGEVPGDSVPQREGGWNVMEKDLLTAFSSRGGVACEAGRGGVVAPVAFSSKPSSVSWAAGAAMNSDSEVVGS